MSRHPFSVAVLAVIVAGLALGPGAPAAAAVPADITGAFIDGWPGQARPYAPLSRLGDESLIYQTSNFYRVRLESAAEPFLSFDFDSGDFTDLEVGSYSTTAGASAVIQPLECTQPQVVTFEILELERAPGGSLTRFAADFEAACPTWQPPLADVARGSVRFHSTIGFGAFSIAPVRTFPWLTDATLPDQPIGTSAETEAFVVTNTGSLPLAVGIADPVADDLDLGSGTCDGDDVAPGGTCTIDVAFGPSEPGRQDFALTLLTPDLSRTSRTLAVRGLGTTTTSISVRVDPLFHEEAASFQGYTEYDIELEPADAEGAIYLESSCGISRQTGVGGALWISTPPGPCEVTASFVGTAGSGYFDSDSDAVDFVQPVRATVFAQPTSGAWVTGNEVTIHAEAAAGNGDEPSDGTLSLIDTDTDDVLATMAVTPTDRSMDVGVVTWTAGTRALRAVYTSPTMVGSTFLLTYEVEGDDSAPTLTIHPDDFTGYVQDPDITLVLEPYDQSNEIVAMRVSNDGLTWFEAPFDDEVAWSIDDVAYGGTTSDGSKTIHAQVKDAVGLWSETATWPITLDRAAPTGSFTIEDGAAYANATAVTLDLAAVDALSPLATVQLSNDGVTWTTRTYAASQAWTLAAGSGTRTVRARWQDEAGNWSTTKLDTIVLDATAPTVTAPRRGFVAGTTVGGGGLVTRLPWSGSDAGSGVARYELARQTDGGAWTMVSSTLTSPTTNQPLATEHTYRFRVRGVDAAGNVSAWAYGEAFRVSRFSEGNSRITYAGRWYASKASVFWGGVARASSTAGARASITFTGRTIAWVGSVGPTRGKAEVYVNGSRVATIDLYSPTGTHQRVLWVGSWTTAAPRTVSIRVLGTSGRPRVDLDAFVTAN